MIGTTISHYKILEKLGEGGMGVVYKAEDTKLERTVALKILPPHLSSDASFLKRFKREARAVAKLSHSNIIQIFDIAEDNDLHFFSMEYVEGETLDKVLEKKGKFEPSEAVRIISQVALALEHAHKHNIIHRDVKPSNVIIDGSGNAKVLDFGLARAADDRSKVTQSGTLIGTLGYMSPEQCRGEELDFRTDVYSLGVVLYEMLTGKPPFDAPNEVAMIHKIVSEEPIPVEELRPDVPSELTAVVSRAMAKDRDSRFRTTSEFLDGLGKKERGDGRRLRLAPSWKSKRIGVRPVAMGIAAMGICIAAIAFLGRQKEEKAFSSIAVLPFVDMSAEKDQEYFCDGISEELINALARFTNLKVVARTSAFSFKGRNVTISDIGKKLNVDTVLEGSIRKAGNRLRITTQLVKVSDGFHLWSEQYDRDVEDIFAVQEEISRAIVKKLRVRLADGEQAVLAKRPVVDHEIYDLYLQGRFFFHKGTEEDIEKAIQYFEQAIEKAPDYAQAYAGLADCYHYLPIFGYVPTSEVYPKAKQAALTALEIDDTLAEAHVSLGNIRMFFDWDWENAGREFQRALELNPGGAMARHWHAFYLLSMGRVDAAVEEMQKAVELDPLSLFINRGMGIMFLYAARFDEGIEVLKKGIEMDPDYPATHYWLGWMYYCKSMYEEAVAEMEYERKIAGTLNPRDEGAVASFYARIGRKDEARKVLNDLLERSEEVYVPANVIAELYLRLGETDQAFHWLNKAADERDIWLSLIKGDTLYDDFRSDPRYEALLKRMNLDK